MDATFQIGERVEITPRSLTGQAMAPVPAVIVAGPTGNPPTYHAAATSGYRAVWLVAPDQITRPLDPRARVREAVTEAVTAEFGACSDTTADRIAAAAVAAAAGR